ncbi:DUF4349 domain-containing protein [Frankia sp. Cppng1_Ct_nod]|uniref:DUF4349 domain-containing protein n=1 Tax=Frankia sp. Cppng1_Ct_nod TaxID=2897162 RepID=UPI001041A824|nr:DUF4349 domain-containing protein [Frankia sp. Cppng1_Ct_nod]
MRIRRGSGSAAVGGLAGRAISPRRVVLVVAAGIVVIVGAAFVLGETGSDEGSSSSLSSPAVSAPVPSPGIEADSAGAPQRAASMAGSAPAAKADPARPAGAEPRIVRTGSMSLQVRRGGVDAAVNDVAATAKGFGGYLSALQSAGTGSASESVSASASESVSASEGDGRYATVTLRVPTASFDDLRARVGKIGEVRASTVTSQDVTGQYIDRQSRLKALQTSRDTYVTLLSRAGTIAEILSVQQQIDNVQVQIEQLEGQRQVLADSSALATLTVSITEQGAPAEGFPDTGDRGLAHAVRLSWDRFVGGLSEIVALVGPAMLILLVAVVAVGSYRLVQRVRGRTRGRTATTAPTR